MQRFSTLLSAAIAITVPVISIVPQANPLASIRVGAAAQAELGQPLKWQPPQGGGSAGGTLSGGRRSGGLETACRTQADTTRLALLVPGSNAGLLTTSAHPQFFWRITTAQPVEVKFFLSSPEQPQPLFQKSMQVAQSELVGLQLPETVILKPGVKYRWTVMVACGQDGGSEIFARSFIQRVEQPEVVTQAQGKSALARAAIFSQAGLWYDALATLVTAQQAEPQNAEIAAALDTLLTQAQSPSISSVK